MYIVVVTGSSGPVTGGAATSIISVVHCTAYADPIVRHSDLCVFMCGEQQREACFASLCCPPSTKLSSFVAAVLCHRIVLRTSSFITKILCCSFTWKWRKFWLNSLSIQELKLTNTLLNSPRRRVQQFDLTSSPCLRIPQTKSKFQQF